MSIYSKPSELFINSTWCLATDEICQIKFLLRFPLIYLLGLLILYRTYSIIDCRGGSCHPVGELYSYIGGVGANSLELSFRTL